MLSHVISKNDFDKICRTCLKINEKMTSIFQSEVLNMLTICTTINIHENDGLPNQICPLCSNKIIESYIFKQQCENSDRILRQIKIEDNSKEDIIWKETLNSLNYKLENLNESNSYSNQVNSELKQNNVNCKQKSDEEDDDGDDVDDEDNDDDDNVDGDGVNNDFVVEDKNCDDENDVNVPTNDESCSNSMQDIRRTSKRLKKRDRRKLDNINNESVTELYKQSERDENPIKKQEAYFYPIETSDGEQQKESALERALLLGPEKCDPVTKTCKICNKVLYNVHSLVRHVETHNKNRKFEIVCRVCGKGFYEKKHIKNHMLRHKGEARFLCDDCKKPFYELNALRAHVKRKHPNKSISCKECDEEFVLQQDLDLHMRTHVKHQYFCPDCGKPFVHRYLLRKHQWMHAKERMFHCKQCEKSFKSKQVLHLHYKRCHSGEKKREICNICGKSVVYLKNHIYIHNNEKYECMECPQEFTNKYSLDKHMKRKHSNLDETTLNPYLCNICGKRSENLTMLNRHILTHSDEKTHKCPICGKLFKSIELVNSHVRYTHNNVRNFKCTVCSKSFHTTSGLKLHMRTHTGERPYECEVCGKAFQQRSTLKTHMKVHGFANFITKPVLEQNTIELTPI